MGSGVEFHGKVYWTSRELLEHLLKRGAELGQARLPADHPATAWLAAHVAIAEGKSMSLDGALPVEADRADLAALLEAAGQEGVKADLFDPAGAKWVKNELARLTLDLRGGPATLPKHPEPFPSRGLLIGGGLSMLVLCVVLVVLGAEGHVTGIVSSLGFAALTRAFWMSWGLTGDEDQA